MKLTMKNSIQRMVMVGVFAALLAVLSQISVPMPTGIPVTLQTFAVALCGYVLFEKLGTMSVLVYLALGAVGLPVFAGVSGGFGVFLGMTGGFLWGFIPLAFLCGLGMGRSNKAVGILLGIGGLAVCHVFGITQFAIVSGTTWWSGLLAASVPYLLKDGVSVVLAYFVAQAILMSLKKAKLVTIQ